MAEQNTKTKKRHGLMWLAGRLAIVGAMAYLAVTFVSGQVEVAQKQRQLDDLTGQLEQRVEENTELQRILDSGDTAAYIEKVAREQGYARPEERVYIDITGE